MNIKKFTKTHLINTLDLPDAAISDTIIGHRRWSVEHEIVFMLDGVYYKTQYSVGATERQDESPWQYDDQVECIEVKQVDKVIKVWEPV